MSLQEAIGAIHSGETDALLELIRQDPQMVNLHSPEGWTLLHYAAYFGQTSCAELLLANGADLERKAKNSNGNTPLQAAIVGRKSEMVGFLLKRGADVHHKQSGGWTALHEAALRGEVVIAEILLSYGADVHARKDDQKEPLAVAQEQGHLEVVELLQG